MYDKLGGLFTKCHPCSEFQMFLEEIIQKHPATPVENYNWSGVGFIDGISNNNNIYIEREIRNFTVFIIKQNKAILIFLINR